jgi:hypothetical protein
MITTIEKTDLTPTEKAKIHKQYKNNWVKYIHEQLGLHMWSGMEMIIDSVQRNKRTSVRAFHGSSKTISAAAIAVTFLNLYENSIVISTAPGHRQVRDLLWKEIFNFYALDARKKPPRLMGNPLKTLRIDITENSYMLGFSSDEPVRYEGYHAPHILWVLDEAKGFPQWVYDAVEGSLTGGFARVLEISTTDGADQQCPFRKHHTSERSQWNCIQLAAYDSPFVDPNDYQEYSNQKNLKLYDYRKDPDKPEWNIELSETIQVTTKEWIDDKINTWKTDRPDLWETKVEGNFWEQGTDNIIPLKWVMGAVNKIEPSEETGKEEPAIKPGSVADRMRQIDMDVEKILKIDVEKYSKEIKEEIQRKEDIQKTKKVGRCQWGVDVARFGDDANILTRFWEKILTQEAWSKKNTAETSGIIIKRVKDFTAQYQLELTKDNRIKIDAVGVGAGVCDNLAEHGMPVIGIESAGKAFDSDTYYNIRAEMWWNAREIFERQFKEGNVISIPNDPELIEDLTGMKYKTKMDGRILVEDKNEYKKRSGRSPDKGDSAVYCIAIWPYDPSQDQYFSEEQVSEGVLI